MDDSAIQPQPAPPKPFPGFAQPLLVLILFMCFTGIAGVLGTVLVGVAIGALHRVMSHPVLAEALP